MLNSFDKISFFYDFLAKLIFGAHIIDSQKYFLNKIQSHSKVLILGGGTGWLLAELLTEKPNCEVWYVEASAKMIIRSRNRIVQGQAVHFIHGTEDDIPQTLNFDVAITNFYLDLFSSLSLPLVINKIQRSLKPGSLWIVTDFVKNKKWWQASMLKIMYWFFRSTCGIESTGLPPWPVLIGDAGFAKVSSKFFYKNFIEAVVWRY